MTENKKGEFTTVEMVMKNSEPYLRLLGRWEDKSKMDITVKGNPPYFYILKTEENLIDFTCNKEYGFKSIFGDELIKVIIDNPFDQREFFARFTKHYEGDIVWPTRNLVDMNVFTGLEYNSNLNEIKPSDININPRIMTLDIETLFAGGSNKDMTCPIISISFHDSYTDNMYCIAVKENKEISTRRYQLNSEVNKREYTVNEFLVEDEKELLNLFKSFVVNFNTDIFVAWNAAFDMIYIMRRLEILNLHPEEISPVGKYYYSTEHINSGATKTMKYGKKEKKVMIRGRAIIDLLK